MSTIRMNAKRRIVPSCKTGQSKFFPDSGPVIARLMAGFTTLFKDLGLNRGTLGNIMNFKKLCLWVTIVSFTLLLPSVLFADTNCDDGASPLNSAPPSGITPEEIIQKFAAKEAIFKEARNNYRSEERRVGKECRSRWS